jgi:uncharacterized damage-inducible protein DinB
MGVIDVTVELWDANRARTLATLDEIEKLPEPQRVLGFRPGPGRAHIAWQLMHIGVTEELFATSRLSTAEPDFPADVARFRGGSTPDDDIPSPSAIRELLNQSRVHLKKTISGFSDDQLEIVPEPLKERGWTLGKVLQVLTWHEAHHQGQAHLTLNLWKAMQS